MKGHLWAPKWSQTNNLDGHREHLCLFDWRDRKRGLTVFSTRAACRAYIENQWGYIRARQDLRQEPHCWRVPQAVKVQIVELGA